MLLAALALVQMAGLTIHAFDRVDLLQLAQTRDVAVRAMGLFRSIALIPPERRAAGVQEIDPSDGSSVVLDTVPPGAALAPAEMGFQRQLTADMSAVPVPVANRPRELLVLGGPDVGRLVLGMRLAAEPGEAGRWLAMDIPMPAPQPWNSLNFLVSFVLMTAGAAGLVLWAVRRLTRPVATLALAAEALGRNVNAPPLSEEGPAEVATAAAAFNTMAARIRKFVEDRTFILTAIGHDLRTPITRMKLRCEFIEEEEVRRKLLGDLDALEAMIAATLSFGRDATAEEPVSAVDLAELARTILDEAADARPDLDPALDLLFYAGPDHMTVWVRPIALKRALTNLVSNALAYGGSARVTLLPAQGGAVTLMVDDDGPGVPAGELEQVFQPFHRVEASRNRETGGVGLGLPIARNVLRAHGGDVLLANRPGGGARATVVLPQ